MPLDIQNLSYRYPDRSWVFRHLSLTVTPGEVVGISGPSGCGKSTLARLMAGYEKPVGGRVTLNGELNRPNGFNPVQLIFQHPEKAVNPRWRMHRILNEGFRPDDLLLSSLGIEKAWLKRWPNELSGGELQRFCVARALGPDARYLIADEISTMLDPVTQSQIWTFLLSQVKQRGLGLIAISHDRPLLDRVCDRILFWDSLGLSEEIPVSNRQPIM